MQLFLDPIGFLSSHWGVALLFDFAVFCGLAAYHKTWGWVGVFLSLFAVCALVATLGSMMALNAAGPLAMLAVGNDYGDTWFNIFGQVIAIGSIMLVAGVGFVVARNVLAFGDRHTQPKWEGPEQ